MRIIIKITALLVINLMLTNRADAQRIESKSQHANNLICISDLCHYMSPEERHQVAKSIVESREMVTLTGDVVLLSDTENEKVISISQSEKPKDTKLSVGKLNEEMSHIFGSFPLATSNIETEKTDTTMVFRYRPNRDETFTAVSLLTDKSSALNSLPRARFSTFGFGKIIQGGSIIEISLLKNMRKLDLNSLNPKPDGFYLRFKRNLK